jgi:hypothetical protein
LQYLAKDFSFYNSFFAICNSQIGLQMSPAVGGGRRKSTLSMVGPRSLTGEFPRGDRSNLAKSEPRKAKRDP